MCPAYPKWFPTMRIVLLACMILSSQMVSELMPLRFIFHISYLSRIISSHEQLASTGWAIFCDEDLAVFLVVHAESPTACLTSNVNSLLTSTYF
jgi:hypothetical protein